MRIKVGPRVISDDHTPIMVVLTQADRHNIANMAENANRYAAAPDGFFATKESFARWMEEGFESDLIDEFPHDDRPEELERAIASIGALKVLTTEERRNFTLIVNIAKAYQSIIEVRARRMRELKAELGDLRD